MGFSYQNSLITIQLVLRRDLILLQLSIGHFVGPGAQGFLRESDDVNAQCHAASKALARLNETLRRAERRQAVGEIFQSLLAEIRVRVIGEKCAVDRAVLQAVENLFRLVQFMRRRRIVCCE
jgi:hypothetical protein